MLKFSEAETEHVVINWVVVVVGKGDGGLELLSFLLPLCRGWKDDGIINGPCFPAIKNPDAGEVMHLSR